MKTFAPYLPGTSRSTGRLAPAVVVIAVGVVGACSGGAADPTPPTGPPPGSNSTELVPASPTAVTPESPTAKPAEAATLPDVVGMNHQRAQDTMQAAGFYALREVDASGQGRALVWDRNWVVVSQSPEGGADVPVDTVVTLNSKKADE